MKLHEIQVSTYSGYKADERPRAFFLHGKKYVIKEIVNQACVEMLGRGFWRRYIVKTDEELTYTLLYNEGQDQWFLEV
ncbi:MAG: hypothetical protein U0586_14020 [Candidatus Brocadiaceae bacterium]